MYKDGAGFTWSFISGFRARVTFLQVISNFLSLLLIYFIAFAGNVFRSTYPSHHHVHYPDRLLPSTHSVLHRESLVSLYYSNSKLTQSSKHV